MKKILFILIVLAQISVLCGMAAKREMLLKKGEKITLKCKPVDPRSLFSGDYVQLRYEISDLPEEMFDRGSVTAKKNTECWVVLAKDTKDAFWSAVRVSSARPKDLADGEQIIKGRFENGYGERITYGVEEYFVPQGEGRELEKEMAEVSVEVSLSADGESAISRLFVEEKEVKFY